MATSTHRNRHIEFWVERAAQAVARARNAHGDEAVGERIERTISREDAETTARVLRILTRELGSTPTDLEALERRVRDLAGLGVGDAEAAPGGDSPDPDGADPNGSDPNEADADGVGAAEPPKAGRRQPQPGERPIPPTGLRSDMLRRRRRR